MHWVTKAEVIAAEEVVVMWEVLIVMVLWTHALHFPLQPIKFRGDVRLNVEEKKTRSAREGERRDIRPRGPGGPRDKLGGPRGPMGRGGLSQKPSFGGGRGSGPSEGRFSAQRQWNGPRKAPISSTSLPHPLHSHYWRRSYYLTWILIPHLNEPWPPPHTSAPSPPYGLLSVCFCSPIW